MKEFKSLHDLLETVPTEQDCVKYLEDIRWGGNVVSPFDETSKVYTCKVGFKCKNTGKYFNVKAGTIFESSPIKLRTWFTALYIFSSHKKGISSYQLASDMGVTQKTAWFMLHRLRTLFAHPTFKRILSGTVEADATYIGGKHKNMHKSKRDKANEAGTGYVNKTAVFGMMERDGILRTGVINKEDGATVRPIIAGNIASGSLLVTDGHGAYKGTGLSHEVVEHEKGEYARDHRHTGNIDGFWSQFKRGIYGIYHHISPKHTDAYAQEFTLRHNTRQLRTNQRFDFILTNMECRLTYKQLIA